jgi:uncharacterized protein
MNILLTGATGFIGTALCRSLHDAGHTLRILTRNRERAKTIFPSASFFEWNPEQDSIDLQAFENLDAVINLAGETVAQRWTKAAKQRMWDSRIKGTQSLMRHLAELPQKPSVIITASAIGYYGDRGEEVLYEESASGEGFLPSLSQAWEQEFFAYQDQFARLAAVRIGIVLGPDGGALQKMLLPFRLGLGGPLGTGRQWMSWIHRDDLLNLFVKILNEQSLAGPINGVSPEPIRNSAFTKVLAKVLHRPAVLPAPSFALNLLLGEMSKLLLDSQRVLPLKALEGGFKFRYNNLCMSLQNILDKK